VPAGRFYEAEAYHQKFTERTGIGMCHVLYAPVAAASAK
jgi:peptide methionine sulfoxide reductase MsrA